MSVPAKLITAAPYTKNYLPKKNPSTAISKDVAVAVNFVSKRIVAGALPSSFGALRIPMELSTASQARQTASAPTGSNLKRLSKASTSPEPTLPPQTSSVNSWAEAAPPRASSAHSVSCPPPPASPWRLQATVRDRLENKPDPPHYRSRRKKMGPTERRKKVINRRRIAQILHLHRSRNPPVAFRTQEVVRPNR